MTMEETLNPKVLWVVGRKGWDAEVAGGKLVRRGSLLAGGSMMHVRQGPSMGRGNLAYSPVSVVGDFLIRANRLWKDKTPVFFFMQRVPSW
jgi:hypothetical protein